MRSTKIFVGALLASSLAILPADAAGLLSGLTSGLSGGSSGGSTSTGVPGVATVSVNNGSSGTTGNATLLGGGGSTLNLGLGGLVGGDSNLGVTLPGSGNDGVDGSLGNAVDSLNGVTGNGGDLDTALNDSGLSGDNGGLGGAIGGNGGLLGDNGDGSGLGGLGGGLGGGDGSGPGTGLGGGILAGSNNAGSLGVGGDCRQDTRGIVQLLKTRYSPNSASQWARAANVQVVPIRMCPQIRTQVNNAAIGSAGIGMMRGMAESDPLISTSLNRARYNASRILGVAQSNGTLTVYVY